MTQARRRSPSAPKPAADSVHVRRAYTDGRHGQLHLTTGYPAGGGFDERSPLLCIHPGAASGLWFQNLLPELGRDRSVYAPDLPGHGQSDPMGAAPLTPADLVAAMADFLDSMRLRSVDLLGHGLGAGIAAELAALRPQQVRRVVLVALPDAGKSVAHSTGSPASRAAPPGPTFGRLSAVNQMTLLVYPADAVQTASRAESLHPQHSTVSLSATTEALYGSGVVEMARTLRTFVDA